MRLGSHTDVSSNRIVLTHELLPKVIKYYHESMAHAESAGQLSKTIKQHFHHRGIDDEVKRQLDECTTCAKNKRGGCVYGETAPQDASAMPWQEVHCDSIGPWKIELRARTLKFHAMTMICLLYTSPSPRDQRGSRMPSSA